MKKILPIFLVLLFFVAIIGTPLSVFAQTPQPQYTGVPPTAAPGNITVPSGGVVVPVDTVAPGGISPTSTAGQWVVDPEVTFTGKNAARSGLLLDWALRNYNWVCVRSINPGISQNGQCDDTNNPLRTYWSLVMTVIVVPFLFIVILATAMVIIISRGRSITIMRFLPRFVAVILLIIFSYAIVQFLAQFVDVLQGFFLQSTPNGGPCPPNCISQKDLLYVGWKYETFIGLRKLGDFNAESSFISILLTKLTALTYFVMVIILIVRKIILWFFVIVSPIFPILLMYYPTRNTGKIWIGEFFRWLLYAPLFALFLKGLVFMWRNQIPLVFSNPSIGKADQIIFPTAINILLGGPKQYVTPTNSVNLTETFALYVVALIMLWTVIILPWILLQIFLEYASNFTPGDSGLMKAFMNNPAKKAPILPPAGPASSPQGGGATLTLPFAKKFSIPTSFQPHHPAGAAKAIPTQTSESTTVSRPTSVSTSSTVASTIAATQTNTNKAQALNLANIQLPSMRDIAKYETSLLSKDKSRQQSVTQTNNILEKIATPTKATTPVEQAQFVNMRQKLMQQSKQGNIVASAILKAANSVTQQKAKTEMSTAQIRKTLKQIANPASAPASAREKMQGLHDMVARESREKNSKLASSILSVNDKTSDQEIRNIHSQLQKSKGQKMNSSVNSMLFQQSNVSVKMKSALVQIGNPSKVSTVNREAVAKLNETLKKASSEGNSLAVSILSVSDKTPAVELEELQNKIVEAQEKGEPIAAEIAQLAQKQETESLPAVNRVQAVNQQDYQAVKDMWKENYQKLDVPEEVAGTRTDWIKDDIENIDQIVSLLSSTDEDKIQEGMDKVSTILPFLLVGGFSQTEIISYLRAKQDAAKEVATQLVAEEETKVSVDVKKKAAQQTMAASLEDAGGSTGVPSAVSAASSTTISSATTSSSSPAEEDDSPLANLSAVAADVQQESSSPISGATTHVTAQSPQGLNLREIVQYETKKLQGAKEEAHEIEKSVLKKLANPALAAQKDQQRFAKLHDFLVKQSQEGDSLATAILATKETASPDEIATLSDKLKEEGKKKGSPLVAAVSEVALSQTNQGQGVTAQEYAEIGKTWEENYKSVPIPHEFGNDRVAWIKADAESAKTTVSLLSSADLEKKKEGLQKATYDMPYLVLGGFSNDEITGYLSKKIEAAQNVVSQLEQDEANKVVVDIKAGDTQQAMAATVQETQKQTATSTHSSSMTDEEREQNAATNVITMTNSSGYQTSAGSVSSTSVASQEQIQPLSLKDFVRYESQRTQSQEQVHELEKVLLKNIADPALAAEKDKKRFAKLNEFLTKKSHEGDPLAAAILATKTTASREEIKKLNEKLKEESKKKDSQLMAGISQMALSPEVKREVSDEDYEDIEKMWEEYYRTLPVPQEFGTDRIAWIKADETSTLATVNLLSSPDQEKKEEGLRNATFNMPYLVLGGFSIDEIIMYLEKKVEAAKHVIAELQKDEESKVLVNAGQEEAQEQHAVQEEKE